ncbi:NAD binding Rossmann fold oxidoreductase [Ganoderma leucocontextum]|nr:NAD binding Rossmann fold oxidoreductase [Ganoderma leucocontextum]
MAMILQLSTFLEQYLHSDSRKVPKSEDALRLGILSTAAINSAAIVYPAKTHGGVIVSAIASRDLKAAQEAAKKFDIPKAYGSYEEMLNEPGIDAVYISVPNGMHGEMTRKALNAGKHVLLEKPFTANADEARAIVKLAAQKNLVLVEAFHWQYHPAAHWLKDQLDSGKYGEVLRTFARMTTPKGSIPRKDIRWEYNLAGGSLMDMTYVVSATRFFLAANVPREVASAKARLSPKDQRVDDAMEATLRFDLGGRMVEGKLYTDMWRANMLGLIPRVWELPSIEIETEHAVIYFYNFMMPHVYHYITIYDKRTKKTTTEKHYGGGPKWGDRGQEWWSTYRYQLEAFVDMVRGKQPPHWVAPDNSIAQMETIDMVYEKSGLGRRRPTQEVLSSQAGEGTSPSAP